MHEEDKRAAAMAAVAEVLPGMLVGLGTGSTAFFAIEELGRRVRGGLAISAVATSRESERQARAQGIEVIDFAGVASVDLTIDGADQIDGLCRATKGAGGAMLREKIVAAASRRMVVIADASKRVEALTGPVPVEILPFACASVLAALGDGAVLRRAGDTPFVTDNGNWIADVAAALDEPRAVATRFESIPGVLGHGLFLDQVNTVFLASRGVVTRLERSSPSR